jgi:hypothetical protein
MKTLSEKNWEAVEKEVKHLLHASRDCLRNQGENTLRIAYSARDSYYAEAFGILRGLVVLGYGYFGSSNLDAIEERRGTDPRQNLKYLFDHILTREVLEEEGFHGDHRCEHCLTRYGKDDKKLKDEGKLGA